LSWNSYYDKNEKEEIDKKSKLLMEKIPEEILNFLDCNIDNMMSERFIKKTGIDLSISSISSINYHEEEGSLKDIYKDNQIDPQLYEKYDGELIYAPFFLCCCAVNEVPIEEKKDLDFIENGGYGCFINGYNIIFLPIKYIPKNEEINKENFIKELNEMFFSEKNTN